jgi:hypothetical protein
MALTANITAALIIFGVVFMKVLSPCSEICNNARCFLSNGRFYTTPLNHSTGDWPSSDTRPGRRCYDAKALGAQAQT